MDAVVWQHTAICSTILFTPPATFACEINNVLHRIIMYLIYLWQLTREFACNYYADCQHAAMWLTLVLHITGYI